MAEEDLAVRLAARFEAVPQVPDMLRDNRALCRIAGRASCRRFRPEPLDADLLETLCAVALSAPSKSDLQQRDIVIVDAPDLVASLKDLVAAQAWIAGAPSLVVVCANNRRQRQIHEWAGRPFVNDHLDAFFNASVDAAILLGTLVVAAEAAGLGCCPISTIRNKAAAASTLLGLPDHVFPVAALAIGVPESPERPVSARLPLSVTVHRNRFGEAGLREALARYDTVRAAEGPEATQRSVERFGRAAEYGWSEDKTRQYALPERTDFGAFVRMRGFNLG